MAEAWFSTLKTELIDRQPWPTRALARRAVFEFVDVFYNRQRLHSSLGYLSPVDYGTTRTRHRTTTQAA